MTVSDTQPIPVEIVEVSVRDGLQNDPAMASTATKVELIERLIASGIKRLEAVSYVNPKRVPQMADAEAVMAAVPRPDDVTYIGLVLNRRGFDRAIDTGVDEINTVVVASETFSQRNQGMSTAEAAAVWHDIADRAASAGIGTSVTVSAAFGCPFEAALPLDRLLEVVELVMQSPPAELALADTIGVAVPTEVRERVGAVAEVLEGSETALRCHFHNTRNTGIANVAAAVEAGVRVIDASAGGIGGCPFAPAATGNIATEDVVYLLERMGYSTGVNLGSLIDTTTWLESSLGHTVPSMLSKAGAWPPEAG